jgi:4-diphosphocytidyl-2-C-methyl-D-erythritol kinase
MIVFPNCKINLGLRILHKRSDGFHDLETVFYPVPLTDILEITIYKESEHTQVIPFTTSGLPFESDTVGNLCTKAYKLLKKDFPDLPYIQMHLHKVIPLGAGLGGGSADAAFTLKLLNKKFNLALPDAQLIHYAFQLGSDCPFFITNKPCYATGKGELMEEVKLNLSAYKLVIVNPGIHINTGEAFRHIVPDRPEKSVKEIIAGPIKKWKDELKNDFETFAFKRYPEIVNIKDQLYIAHAVYASMSGSGSTVYGIFPKEKKLKLSFPHHYLVHESNC